MQKIESLRYLPAVGRFEKPWKNGGGVTRDILVVPDGAGMEEFDWRVSMADVAKDGPFSIFPQIDREIAILSGVGITLNIAGRAPAMLTPQSPPYAFPGDTATSGALLDGPITDLNLMMRRGKISGQMRWHELEEPSTLAVSPGLLFWHHGSAGLEGARQHLQLHPLDAVHILADTTITLLAAGARTLLPDRGPARLARDTCRSEARHEALAVTGIPEPDRRYQLV